MHPVCIVFSLEKTDAQVVFPPVRAMGVQNLGN